MGESGAEDKPMVGGNGLVTSVKSIRSDIFTLRDEVAKRGRKGQQNPSGARTSGLRGDEQRHRSAHRGGAPGRRTRVPKAGANTQRSAGMSGIRLKCGDRGGRRQTELRGA